MPSAKEQLGRLTDGVGEIIKEEELRGRSSSGPIREDRPLSVKQGFDPSAPDLHLGHAIGLRKLRQFQDLGHKVIVIIGDYTGMMGDPTERAETRPRLTHEQVRENARTLQGAALQDRRSRSHVRGCHERRLVLKMSFADVMDLAGRYTVARILERDDFTKQLPEPAAHQHPRALLSADAGIRLGRDQV